MKNNELIEFLYWGGIFGIEFNIKAEMSQLFTIQIFQKWMGDGMARLKSLYLLISAVSVNPDKPPWFV